jgi:hypothetical protein
MVFLQISNSASVFEIQSDNCVSLAPIFSKAIFQENFAKKLNQFLMKVPNIWSFL